MAARACAGGQICVRLHNSEGVVVSLNGDVGLTRGSGGGRFGERALVNRVARATKAAFGTQTGLCRHSNRSLFASRNRAGKRFAEARDWGGILGDSGRFQVTETALSRVSAGKAAESQRLFQPRQEAGIAQERVVGPAGLTYSHFIKGLEKVGHFSDPLDRPTSRCGGPPAAEMRCRSTEAGSRRSRPH
jgi:hypothetical protein